MPLIVPEIGVDLVALVQRKFAGTLRRIPNADARRTDSDAHFSRSGFGHGEIAEALLVQATVAVDYPLLGAHAELDLPALVGLRMLHPQL